MSFYNRYILAPITNKTCATKPVRIQRTKVVPRAQGVVLEVGFGSGLNLPHYDDGRVEKLYALEPDDAMWRLAAERLAASPLAIERLALSGEEIPLGPASVDTVLVTYTLCTIPDVARALDGMRRVLKPDGRLIFTEHGRAPDAKVARFQDRLNPFWRLIGGGCNLNRPIDQLITENGFEPEAMEAAYIPGPKFNSYHYWGWARPA